MKKYLYPIIYSFVGCVVCGIAGLFGFMKYGASDCDMPGKICDCFCCNSFGLRGYESCGNYGLLLSAGIGIIIGALVYMFVRRRMILGSE